MSKPRPQIPISELPADDALARFDQLRSTLTRTHDEIPSLLAGALTLRRQLGLAEAEGKDVAALRESLAETEGGRESAARKRAACIEAIMQLEPALQGERAALERSRQQYATHAVAQFQERYRDAVANLQACWETGRLLAATLRCEIPMPLPVRLTTSPVDGTSRALPMRSIDAAPVVDAEAAKLGAKLDEIDSALSLVGAIKQSRELDARDHRLALLRGTGATPSGAYRVLQPFRNQLDGCEFAAGQIVDSSLIGGAMLRRLMTGKRFIQPLGLESAAA